MVHTLQLYSHCISIAPGLVLPYKWALLTLSCNCTLYCTLHGTLQLYSHSPGISHVLQYMWGLLSNVHCKRQDERDPASRQDFYRMLHLCRLAVTLALHFKSSREKLWSPSRTKLLSDPRNSHLHHQFHQSTNLAFDGAISTFEDL